ncbi:unnamed protein product [Trichogramma brassicae]|uniref:Uncharacterized protein n=1 Tax=Trichogramma brassicae TaxID=86971 RepID=A0A6H5IXK4_9HYME|nr:unnamed protein product [Trichogramma brassicae]
MSDVHPVAEDFEGSWPDPPANIVVSPDSIFSWDDCHEGEESCNSYTIELYNRNCCRVYVVWEEYFFTEIDCLLVDSLNYWGGNVARDRLPKRFIKFVARTGYRHEPQVDKDGKPQLHQTTPVHHVARRNCSNKNIVRQLMKIFDLNYIDNFGFRHFHVACVYGLEDLVEKFLELGQDPNCVDPVTGDTPLHLAVANDNEHLIEVLLSRGAEPRLTNERTGATPLHAICKRANNAAKAAQLFFDVADKLGRPMRVDAPDKSDDTPLHLALKHRNVDAVGPLLRRGASPNRPNSEGSTALHLVCERYDSELFKTILETSDDEYRPVRVDAKDENGDAPLHLALKLKKYDLAKLLMEAGADATASGAEGATPLHILCKQVTDPHEEPFADLFKHCKERNQTLRVNAQDALGNTPLHVFAQRGLVGPTQDTIRFLLRRGADVNLANNEGTTPLHIICKVHYDPGHYERDFLLSCDIYNWPLEINAQDHSGNTPLHLSLHNSCRNVTYSLLENGANPNLANKKGMTPLHSALTKNNIDSDLIATMLRKDGDPNLADEQGMTPLHLAVKMKNQDSIEMMLERGGNLNSANKKGMTPFHFALEENNEDLIMMLLRKGCNPNSANEKGMTSLHLLCSTSSGCDRESADMLLELGGNDEHRPLQIDARDKKGRTPLQLAVENFLPLTAEAILERRRCDTYFRPLPCPEWEEPQIITMPECYLSEATYTTFALRNVGKEPVVFCFESPKDSHFCVKPYMGVVQGSDSGDSK